MNNNKNWNGIGQSSIFNRQKVRDVIEESTKNNWQQNMAGGAARLTGLFAFLSCVFFAEVQK